MQPALQQGTAVDRKAKEKRNSDFYPQRNKGRGKAQRDTI